MDLPGLEKEVELRLDRLDLDGLWPGFRRYEFVLYDTEYAVLNGKVFPRPEEFWANTAISWQGRQVAIWNTRNDLDMDVLASKLAHEMFHAPAIAAGALPRPSRRRQGPRGGSAAAGGGDIRPRRPPPGELSSAGLQLLRPPAAGGLYFLRRLSGL